VEAVADYTVFTSRPTCIYELFVTFCKTGRYVYFVENFITVLTPAVYDYQYLPEVAVSKKSQVTFRVRAGADAHVALSTMYGDTDRKTYELVLGGWNNSRSAVRYGGRGPVVAQVDTPSLLDPDNFRPFWISWDSDVIQVVSPERSCTY